MVKVAGGVKTTTTTTTTPFIGDNFVLTRSDGVEITAGDFSFPKDNMTFVISQGDGYMNLIVYSSVFSLFKYKKISESNYHKYDSIALYSDI